MTPLRSPKRHQALFELPPPPGTTEIVGYAHVSDGDTIRVNGRAVRIFGVDAPELKQTCTVQGRLTQCGAQARAWVANRVRGRQVACVGENRDRYDRIVATCRVEGRDLGRDLVTAGWAVAFTRYSERYIAEERAAKAARAGMWAGSFTVPADFRRGPGTAAVDAPKGCAIKGNVSAKGERIYHLPTMRSYAGTEITLGKGERWFCSMAQATEAGWRAPRE